MENLLGKTTGFNPVGMRERSGAEPGSKVEMMKNGDEDASQQAPGNAPRSKGPDVGLRARQKVIGVGLKRLYDSVVDEQVPEEFADLLKRLDAQSGSGGRPE